MRLPLRRSSSLVNAESLQSQKAAASPDRLSGMRVALLWSRLGPYHLARATAAAGRLASIGASLELAEVCGRDNYAWETASMVQPPWSCTLFPGSEYSAIDRKMIDSAVRNWLGSRQADVVVVNGWSVQEARSALAWVKRNPGRRAVIMSETKYDDDKRRLWKEWLKRRIVSQAHSGLVGGWPQAEYLAGLGIPRSKIFTGYNAVDNRYFGNGAQTWSKVSRDAREQPYFFASARFIARKNLDGLLRAYRNYRDAAGADAWSLVIAGSGELEGELKALCADLQLDSLVRWPGFLQYDELPRWYAAAGAFIHPAKVEPWGLVVNEAAASSLPLLVAAPVGSRYELVRDGVNGFVFDPYSIDDMTAAMLRMAALPREHRLSMGRAAKEQVDQFGPDRFADGLVAAVSAAVAT